MDFSGKRLSVTKVKEMDMVDFLSRLGYEPSKIKNNDYWYLSPFRDEKTASFKVNRRLNRWFDHGIGKGGNLVDFGVLYHNCTVGELLHKMGANDFSFQKPMQRQSSGAGTELSITIIDDKAVSSFSLLRYLLYRNIPIGIAGKYCREVRYELNGKIYYAIGFKNDAGGYELRNAYFKGSSSPKATTFIDNGAKDVAVFEGFFDFLSYKEMLYNQSEPLRNFLILNSTSFFEKSLSKMQEHNHVHLFLDNGKAGEKFTKQALDLDKEKFVDERSLYKNHDDLNDWLRNIGKPQKRQIRQKPW